MELNRLLLFTSFFLHVRLSKMSPARLICDRRLIQKYVTEAADMEEQLRQCERLPWLTTPVHLPLVGFALRDWTRKTNRAKGQEVLLDVEKLVDGTAAAQEELRQGCAAGPLQKLYERSRSFILQLRNFEWQPPIGALLQGHWKYPAGDAKSSSTPPCWPGAEMQRRTKPKRTRGS
ncbi:thrombopoietin [Sphaerodactylus townsendi]|uniref:thrombopoietin n=1 Tax=Sphaerodactylus townsendi TaxID=933632 RepID=UPI0020275309|nr:thrombopoietin [Sphaerodactylus townsendi]